MKFDFGLLTTPPFTDHLLKKSHVLYSARGKCQVYLQLSFQMVLMSFSCPVFCQGSKDTEQQRARGTKSRQTT